MNAILNIRGKLRVNGTLSNIGAVVEIPFKFGRTLNKGDSIITNIPSLSMNNVEIYVHSKQYDAETVYLNRTLTLNCVTEFNKINKSVFKKR